MKYLTLVLGLVLFGVIPGSLHAKPNLFPSDPPAMSAVVPPNDPVRQDAEIVEKAGILLDFGAGMTPRTARTRRDFAVALSRQRYLLPEPNDTRSVITQFDGIALHQQIIAHASEANVELLRLINEFTPELKQMGQDLTAERLDLLQAPFMSIPRNDPSYKLLGIIQDAGLIQGYIVVVKRDGIYRLEFPGTFSGNPFLEPYEIAHAITQVYPMPVEGTKYIVGGAGALVARNHTEAIFVKHPEVLQAFLALINDFQPVLEKLGQDVPATSTRLALLDSSPFPDVPKDHWAYQAVETIHGAGIVVGYPHGEFRTN
jgi:hypothetical protein